ncbi:lanthionine synthetase C family protein [Streptomyces cellulosae]|uniref:lanthionine synthetase C family protein n=1 Tax=Streptomyces sp. P9-2 TaxID=3423201 RepID=UPI001674E733|nr:hypothetical protein GCM10018771_64830 [Streptomyces cellulosae]
MIQHPVLDLTDAIAARLARPDDFPDLQVAGLHWQSLAYGAPGIALLHIERAAVGRGPWERAHAWLAAAAQQPFTSGPDSHPFHGAPAFGHALACATRHLPGSYRRALKVLDEQIDADVTRRLGAAHHRIDAGQLPQLREFDTLRGLTGYGAYILHRDPASPTLRAVLEYLVRLVQPIVQDEQELPGWWTPTGPSGRLDNRFPGGHANHGVAHGIGGVLALLALAAHEGTTVPGQYEALRAILSWLDSWRHDSGTSASPVWPYWVTLSDVREPGALRVGPQRPSWCYGTAGLARAQQLAALVLQDVERQIAVEEALIGSLTDPSQLAATRDPALCHGFAGLAHVAARVAEDAHPSTVGRLRAVIPALLAAVHPPDADPVMAVDHLLADPDCGPGLLEGAAGIALALLAPVTGAPPATHWDSCLLLV